MKLTVCASDTKNKAHSNEIERKAFRVALDRDIQRMKKDFHFVSEKFTFMIINGCLQILCVKTFGCTQQHSFAGINKFLTYHLEKWPWYLAAGVHACLICSNARSYLLSPGNLESLK